MKSLHIRKSILRLLVCLFTFTVLTASQAFGAAAGYSIFYIPADEYLLATALEDLQNNDPPTRDTHALVAVTAWADDTIVYVDHWEDGYEFDPDDPTDFDERYTLSQGGAQKFETSNIALSRTADPSQECVEDPAATADPNDRVCPCDGRDIIYVAGGSATVTRAGWLEQGNTYQAVAWEVYPVRPQLIKYILPFGEDLNGVGLLDFERVYAFIQATNDNTIIQIDFDNDGTYDSFDHDYDGTVDGSQFVLNKGDVYLLTRDSDGSGDPFGSLDTGTTILGSETIQVQYIIGDQGSNYEVRGLSAFPRGFWDNEYYAPVDDATANDTDIFIYNPHSAALTINWETAGGAGNFSVTAKSTESFNAQAGAHVPNNGAVYLNADDVFWGVSTIDTEGQGNDWGYSLVPGSLLDKEYYMGWAPAYDFSQATAPQTLDEQNGLFITAAQDNIVVWIDEDNDGTADQTFSIDRLQTVYVTSSDTGSLNDDDLSQARILATGPYALAYGQNPDTAVPGDSTAMDLGYTVLPTSDKWFELVLDVEKDVNPSMVSAATDDEQSVFTLEINTYEYTVSGLVVTDTLPANWEYVAGNTTITLPDGTTVTGTTADEGYSTGATGDITWSGTDVFGAYGTTMGENQTITIEYTAQTVGTGFASGDLSINEVEAVGTRTVEGVTQTFSASDFAFVTYGDSVVSVDKTSDVDPAAYPGDTVEYTFTMSHDGGTQAHNDVQIYDPIPYGTNYVANSSALVLSQWEDVQDDFSNNYSTDSTTIGGSQDWTDGSWTETDPYGSGAGSGAVSVSSEQLVFAYASTSATVEDAFTTNDVYTGDDGSQSWTDASWTEFNDDASAASGVAQVDGGIFQFAVGTNSETVADNFSTGDYTDDDGSQSWQDASWTETNDDASATSGVAQVTGNALRFAATAHNVRDEFTTNGSYAGNNGSDNWSGSWTETDRYGVGDSTGPTGGFVWVDGNELEFRYLASYVSDDFTPVDSYAGNDGTDNWIGNWVEGGDDAGNSPTAGNVQAEQGRIEFQANVPADAFVYRLVDVTGATDLNFSFDYDNRKLEAGDTLGVYYWDGAGWSLLVTYDGSPDDSFSQSVMWDPATQGTFTGILFYVLDGFDGKEQARIDNVRIDFNAAGTQVVRVADLSGETTAELTFDYSATSIESDDTLVVEVSDDGTNYVTLDTFTSADANGTKTYSNLESGITLNSTVSVRFRVTDGMFDTDDVFNIDNVDITYGTPTAATTASVHRETADLSSAETATLTFDYTGDAQNESGDTVVVEASTDGSSYTVVGTYDGITGSSNASINLISPVDYATATTHIRFRVSAGFTEADESFTIDNVQIAYDEPIAATDVYIEREPADLSSSGSTARLSFDYAGDADNGADSGTDNVVEVQVSSTGLAGSWVTVGTYTNITSTTETGSGDIDISSYTATGNTHIRFEVTSGFENIGETFTIDNVVIAYTVSGAAGSSIQRETVDLSGLTITNLTLDFDYTGDADNEAGDTLVVEASDDGVSYTVVGTYDGITATTPANSGNIDISAYASANTHVRFRASNGFDAAGETFTIDNVDIDYDYTVLSGAGGDPPNFVPNTNYDLSARRTLTLTYSVTVEDPFPIDAGSQITNTACATSTATSIPLCADVTDDVVVPSPDGASVGNRVWLDSNANGKLDVGESGISGVVMVLKDQNGFEVGRTTTDANGFYLFSDVPSGTGYFVEIESGLPANVTQTTHGRSDNRSNPFGIATAGTYQDNFGSGSYTNSDSSLNWVSNEWMEKDAGDSGVDATTGDIQVTGGALQINGFSGTGNYIERSFSIPVGAATTTLSFDWTTAGVESADDITLEIRTYEGDWVELAVDAFTGLTGANSGSFSGGSAIDISAYQSVNTTIRFRVNAEYSEANDIFTVDNLAIDYSGYATFETSYLDQDFGYQPAGGTAIIGNRVWSDADGDAAQDPGEPGLEGVNVRLYDDVNGDGFINETPVTVIDGRLDLNGGGVDGTDDGTFAGYAVIDGYLDINGDGTADGNDPGDDADNVGGYTVINGAIDIDGSGDIDTGGVLDDGSAVPYRETTTSAGGLYLFTNVVAGGTEDYAVWVDSTQTTPTDLANDYSLTTLGLYSLLNVEDGYSYPDNDFGFEPKTVYTIKDKVWVDGDGSEDDDQSGESGIAGVTVVLKDANGTVIATTATDSDGIFEFSGVPLGVRYSWEITDTGGKLSNYYGTTSEATAGSYQMPGILAGDVDFTDEDGSDLTGSEDPNFGYNLSRTIGDTVYNDLNGNGNPDIGEPGLGGVTVSLYRDNNNDGFLDGGDTFLVAEVTDGNGKYLFAGLTDDDYIVSINTTPVGYTYTTESPDNDIAAGQQQASTISGGNSDLARDFGYQATTAVDISGTIWSDEDEEGDIDGTESGIKGVTVQLLNSTGTSIIQDVITDVNGDYTFSSVPGNTTYIVRITDDSVILNGYSTTWEKTEGVQDGTKTYNDQETVVVTTANITDINFGYYKPPVVTRAVIVDFAAYNEDGKVVVRWQTASEHGTVGFNLYRLNVKTGQYQAVNKKLLPGLLHAPAGGSYSYEDKGAKTNTSYTYRLEELEISGKRIAYGPWQVFTGTVFSGKEASASVELGEHTSIIGYKLAQQPLSDEKIARLKARMDARLEAYATKLARKGVQAKIYVEEDGLYFIDANDIATALNISLKKATNKIKRNLVRLRSMGQNVAVWPAEDNSGLYFYGERRETPYSNENVYWLDIKKGLAMKQVKRAPKKAADDFQYFYQWVWEEEDNVLETIIFDDPQEDYWMWGYVYPGNVDQFSAHIATPGIVDTDDAMLTVTLEGATDIIDGNDHHAVIRVNGETLADAVWDGVSEKVVSVPVAVAILNDGDNLVEIDGIEGTDADIFYINHLQMVYPRTYTALNDQLTAENSGYTTMRIDGFTDPDIRVFDITNHRRPLVLTGTVIEPSAKSSTDFQVRFKAGAALRQYLAITPDMIKPCTLIADQPSYLKKRFNVGDYLIITSSDMVAAAQALADYRASQGHVSQVVDVEDIYDEFSNGVVDAEAIREFLAYAYSNWKIPPKYVLLAGEGSFDYKDNTGFGDSVVPTLVIGTPDGLCVTDFPYADVTGNDWVPEFAIGRIPVISPDELVSYTNKVVGYEAATGAWTQQAILAADAPDEGGDFIASSDEVSGLFPKLFGIDWLYQDRMTDAREKLIQKINEGRAFVNFFGHGAIWLIGKDNLFSNAELAQLNNGYLLPVVTAMTCSAGNFGVPGYDAISENMVLKANGGAIAMWSPTGFAYNDNSLELCKGFYSAIFIGGETVLGDAVRRSQENYVTQGDKLYHVDIYNLMGDPALRLK